MTIMGGYTPILFTATSTGVARIFVGGGGGGTRPTPHSLASVVHTFEAVAGSRGSVRAPAVSRVTGGVWHH